MSQNESNDKKINDDSGHDSNVISARSITEIDLYDEVNPEFKRVAMNVHQPIKFGREQPVKVGGSFSFIQQPTVSQKQQPPRQSGWSVSKLEPAPTDCPIERTSRRICCSDAHIIASRITECLRLRSIHAEFNSDKAKCKCENSHGDTFRIKLYTDNNDYILVEVQRRSGCCLRFKREYLAILDAAEGKDYMQSNECSFSMKGLADIKLPEINIEETIKQSLECSRDMITERGIESKCLGLEQLIFMTNLDNANVLDAKLSSQLIMTGYAHLRDFIASIIVEGCVNSDEKFIAEDTQKLRHLALHILSNVMEGTQSTCLSSVIKQDESWFCDKLFHSLLNDVKSSHSKPHNAALATKCLSLIIVNAGNVRERAALDDDVKHILYDALKHGEKCHASLEQAAKSTINLLE
jgi:hypothetical protein